MCIFQSASRDIQFEAPLRKSVLVVIRLQNVGELKKNEEFEYAFVMSKISYVSI